VTSGFESAISEAMAELDKQRAELVRLSQGFGEITGDARSKRRQVSVTVDASGEVTHLAFHGTGYRNLPPAELAGIIVDTIRTARAAAHERLWEELGDVLPGGGEMAQAVSGNLDLAKNLGESLTLPQSIMDMLSSPQLDLFDRIFGKAVQDNPDAPPHSDGKASP
jgi:hypothetical protein